MKLLNKIIKLEQELNIFFGTLTFEELESIFNTQLFGLDEDKTQEELDYLTNDWEEMPLREKYKIIDNITERRKYN